MIEIHPRQIRRHLAALLIHIIGAAWHFVIMTDQGKGFRAGRRILPAQMGITVGREAYMRARRNDGEGKFTRYGAAILEAVAEQFHGLILRYDTSAIASLRCSSGEIQPKARPIWMEAILLPF